LEPGVTAISLNLQSESDRLAVRQQLERILKSGPFLHAPRRRGFLDFIVSETLAGRGDRLKGYVIAREVFDRPEDFDPAIDPIVRIEAGRIREKLREYYDTEGMDDPIRIDLPKGSYTPQIEFRQPTVPTSPPRSAWRERPARTLAASLLAAGVLSLAGVGLWHWFSSSPPAVDKASIAVLPFENIGDDPTWERFADGITEDIVTDLSHAKDLFVVARNSTEVYKDKPTDVRTIGRDLGVHYVLEGSIQPSGRQIRVTAQLVDARTGGHVWSDRYIRPAADLFDVQSDVTEKIAATLTGYQGAVAAAERLLIRRKPPADLTAYEFYLLGMEAKHGGAGGGVTKEGLDQAERLFLKALEIDPQLARAHVGLAYVYE
jgi:TolB-like protein